MQERGIRDPANLNQILQKLVPRTSYLVPGTPCLYNAQPLNAPKHNLSKFQIALRLIIQIMTRPNPAAAFGTFIFFLLTFTINPTTFATTTVAPTFELPGDSGTISLEQYRNQVVYIDFWASWCPPCKHSFPWLNEMQQRYAADGFKIIAINIDEDKARAQEFLENVPASFEIAYDPEGDVADLYHLKVMPSSYLIDRQGNLIHTHKGFKTSDGTRIEEKIRKLLQQDQVK